MHSASSAPDHPPLEGIWARAAPQRPLPRLPGRDREAASQTLNSPFPLPIPPRQAGEGADRVRGEVICDWPAWRGRLIRARCNAAETSRPGVLAAAEEAILVIVGRA